MPGIIFETETRSGRGSLVTPESARYFVVGLFDRGPVTPTLISSRADLEQVYGPRVPYSFAWDDLEVYFREGGGEAYVRRVVGPAATRGSLALPAGDGTPALLARAVSAGAWSAGVGVEVVPGALADTVTVSLYVDDALTARYANVADTAALARAMSATGLLTVTALGTALPAATAGVQNLSAGVDDRAAVTTAAMLTAAGDFTIDLGVGALAIPGADLAVVAQPLLTLAADTRRIALLHGGIDDTRQQVAAGAAALLDPRGDAYGVFYPWVTAPALAGTGERSVPPTGYVAAKRAVAHRETGAFRVPAGDLAAASYITGVVSRVTGAEADALNTAGVSVIRQFRTVTELYGYRSLSTDEGNYPLLNKRDATNAVVQLVEQLLQGRVFGNVDSGGQFYSAVRGAIAGELEVLRTAGGLFPLLAADGQELDPGYSVVVDSTNNTVENLAQGRVNVDIGLRWSPTADLFVVTLTNVAIDATL